jgi:uncharacterized protein YccT (UPF0319 family)
MMCKLNTHKLIFDTRGAGLRLALILMVMAFVSACGQVVTKKLYEGNARPSSGLAIIELPVEVEITGVNGQRISSPAFASQKVRYELLPGKYELVFKYEALWEDDYNNHEVIRSQFVKIDMQLQQGHIYASATKLPTTLEQAREFAVKFHFSLRDVNTNMVYQAETLKFARQGVSALDQLLSGQMGTSEELQNLKYWWERAGEEDRQLFLESINVSRN